MRKRLAVLLVLAVSASAARLVLNAAPASAAPVAIDEAGFRHLWGRKTETGFILGTDITLTKCKIGMAKRNSATALTVIGHGHTIRQTCKGKGVLLQLWTGQLNFDGVTITGGDNTTSPPAGGSGGGIRDVNGHVTLNNSTVTGNNSSGSGGGIAAIGGVTLTNSTVSGNTAALGGGGISSAHSVTVTNSTVTGNVSTGGHAGGIETDNDPVAMTNSTVANSRGFQVGGVSAGFASPTASVSLTASTIHDNASTSGIFGGVGGVVGGSVSLLNSTVTANSGSGLGGGGVSGGSVMLSFSTVVENSGFVANVGANSLTTSDSVVALPTGGRPNCGNLPGTTTTSSGGFNFSDDASCGFTASGDTQNGGNPNLGPLTSNGGPTVTRLPFWYSRLVDAIPVPSCAEPRDQRGITRPQLIQCDIGAVELETPPA